MPAGVPCTRQPTASPVPAATAAASTVVTRSARVRPAMKATRDIGSDLRRSTSPVDWSTAMLIAAPWAAAPMFTAMTPATR